MDTPSGRRRSTRPARQTDDGGFTLIELLVVMIIIGILAAIAIPLFLSQRAKAKDTAVKADVSDIGKEIATYYIGANGPVTLDYGSRPGNVIITDGSYVATVRLTSGDVAPATGASAALDSSTNWCVALTNSGGSSKSFSYSGLNGLQTGTC